MFIEDDNPLLDEVEKFDTATLKFIEHKFTLLRKNKSTGEDSTQVLRAQRDNNDHPYLEAFLLKPLNPFRAYWDSQYAGVKNDNIPVCYTKDFDKPADEVVFKQAVSCKECPHFTGLLDGDKKLSAACKFKNTSFLIFFDAPEVLVSFDMPSTSYQQAGRFDTIKDSPLPLRTLISTAKKVLRTSVGDLYAVRLSPVVINKRSAVLRFTEINYTIGANILIEEFISKNSKDLLKYMSDFVARPIPVRKV